jgi:RimJ/RimL family protein N-acetyltransferase
MRAPGQNSAWRSHRSSSFPLDERGRRYQGMMIPVHAADEVPDHRTPPLVIRPAHPDEYTAIGDLVVAAYRAGGHLAEDDDYGVHLADVAGRADEHPVLVAEREGRIVGSVTICPPGTSHSKDARADELEFRYLGVAEQAWGTGVGEALVGACDDWAREVGATALVLSAIAWNAAAMRLYQRLGFSREPDRDREPAPGIVLQVWRREVGGLKGPSAP